MSDVAAIVFRNTPGAIPLTGVALAFISLGLLMLLGWLALLSLDPLFSDAVTAGQLNQPIFAVYTPAIAWLLGALANLITSFKNLFQSFADLFRSDLIKIAVTLALAVLAILFVVNQKEVMEGTFTFETCVWNPLYAIIISIVNALDLVVASVISIWDIYGVFLWSRLTVILRVVIECAINGDWTVITDFLVAFALGWGQWALAITNFIAGPDPAHDRINFIPGYTGILGSFQYLARIFDCACNYLSFFWDELFALPSSPSLILALDCASNIPVRIVQSWVSAITTPELPQVTKTVEEAQCAIIQLGHFAETVLFFFGTNWLNFLGQTTVSVVTLSPSDRDVLLPSLAGQPLAAASAIPPNVLLAEMMFHATFHGGGNLFGNRNW